MDFLIQILSFFKKFLPNYCLLCCGPARTTCALCAACTDVLPWHIGPSCTRCGLVLPQEALCGLCITDPPAHTSCVYPFFYEPPVDRLLLHLKFYNQLIYAQVLGTLFCEYWTQFQRTRPELIVPMPLHVQRLQERGYNQSTELARIISAQLNIPYTHEHVVRMRSTCPQIELSGPKRRANVRNAFTLEKMLHHAHIAILDDVMTTGATMGELSRLLASACPTVHIEAWCMARTRSVYSPHTVCS